jgi:NADPH:quinone reductase-like Zn-dependent oxidoreductase
MTMMRAVTISEYGGPEVLTTREMARPVAASDELLIRVAAIGINPIDWKLREGYAKERIPLEMPAILGTDISGVVEQVGDDVRGFQINDPIFAMLGLSGAYAEYVTVKAIHAAPKPAALNHAQAASVPLAALTAWQGLFEHGGLEQGQAVLVHAAAGGVGGFAVQLAKHAGAQVTATTSSSNEAFVRKLGADNVIDYRQHAFEEQLDNMDLVLDLVGGDTTVRSLDVLRPGGTLVQVVPGDESVVDKAKQKQVTVMRMMAQPNGEQLKQIAALLDAGHLHTTIAATIPFPDFMAAHEMSQTGRTRGKIVVEVAKA